MNKLIRTLTLTVALAVGAGFVATASVDASSKCRVVGQRRVVAGRTEVCVRDGKAYRWVEKPTKGDSKGTSGSKTTSTAKPVLSVPFVNPTLAVKFYVFGATLPSGVQNPTFEVETADQSSLVFASAAGKVVAIEPTTHGDFTISFILSNENYMLFYDHVSNVRVKMGESVQVGAQLGTVGKLQDGRGRSELMIKDLTKKPKSAQCLTQFGTADFNKAFAEAAKRLNGSDQLCTTDSVQP